MLSTAVLVYLKFMNLHQHRGMWVTEIVHIYNDQKQQNHALFFS